MTEREAFLADPPLIAASDLERWVLSEEGGLLAVDKPGWVACHPSKHGPASSLVGAVRLYRGWDTVHLISRLDRETSGVVLLTGDGALASELQRAVMHGRVHGSYLAVLCGHLGGPAGVGAPLAPDPDSPVGIKVMGVAAGAPGAKAAFTRFVPLATGGGYTLARVAPRGGRKHQIRAHARHLGRPVAGDKIYGPDDRLYLDFIEGGFQGRLPRWLPLRRQALHRAEVSFDPAVGRPAIRAPLPEDLRGFCAQVLGPGFRELEGRWGAASGDGGAAGPLATPGP